MNWEKHKYPQTHYLNSRINYRITSWGGRSKKWSSLTNQPIYKELTKLLNTIFIYTPFFPSRYIKVTSTLYHPNGITFIFTSYARISFLFLLLIKLSDANVSQSRICQLAESPLVSKENLQFLELVFSLKKLAQSATLAHFRT